MKKDAEVNVNVKAATGTQEVIVRQGDALQQYHPAKLAYAGRLDAPRLFMDNKQNNYDPLQCTFVVDTESDKVELRAGEKDVQSSDTITGTLVRSAAIKEFSLNDGTRFSVKDLIELVKRNRVYFANKEEQIKLLANLRNWNVAVTKLYEDTTNENGNAKKTLETRVEGVNLPGFTLMIPIFKGYDREPVEVEFGVDAQGSGVLLYMDSPGLLERELGLKTELMKAEADWFRDTFKCAVIYKS